MLTCPRIPDRSLTCSLSGSPENFVRYKGPGEGSDDVVLEDPARVFRCKTCSSQTLFVNTS